MLSTRQTARLVGHIHNKTKVFRLGAAAYSRSVRYSNCRCHSSIRHNSSGFSVLWFLNRVFGVFLERLLCPIRHRYCLVILVFNHNRGDIVCRALTCDNSLRRRRSGSDTESQGATRSDTERQLTGAI